MKRVILFCLMAALIMSCVLPAMASNLTETQKNKQQVDSKLKDIAGEKKKVLDEKKKLESEKSQVVTAHQQESQAYEKLISDIGYLDDEIDKIEQQISDAEKEYKEQQALFKTRIRAIYENSNNSYLETLLESESISEFFERLFFISSIAKKDRQLLEEMDMSKKNIEFQKKRKEELKENREQLASQKQERIKTLSASRDTLEDNIRETQDDLDKLEKQEDELIKKSNQLANTIKNLQSKKKFVGGSMQWPLPGRYTITSPYGMRYHPILHKTKMHTGIDIGGKSGDLIVAANKGTVIMAGYQGSYGNTVVIDHGGGITTLYAHSSKLLVSVGDEVAAGKGIALVGTTGLSTGPHLHFEVRKNGDLNNPLNYLGK